MLISKVGFKVTNSGKLLRKKVTELNNSNYFVHVKCNKCSSKFRTIWSNRLKRGNAINNYDLCNSCSKTGSGNSQYGKERVGVMKFARSHVKNFSRNFTEETKAKMSKSRATLIAEGKITITSFNRGVKSWYFSTKNQEKFYADSKLELFRMTQLDCDENIISWDKRHGIKINYIFKNQEKYCVPDFLIKLKNGTTIVEEVKGRITEVELIKKEAIKNYCSDNNLGFSFLTQKELNKNGEYRKFLKECKIK